MPADNMASSAAQQSADAGDVASGELLPESVASFRASRGGS